jgi:hypothetical protein
MGHDANDNPIGKAGGRLPRHRQKARMNACFIWAIGAHEPNGPLLDGNLHGRQSVRSEERVFIQSDYGLDLTVHRDLGVPFALHRPVRRVKIKKERDKKKARYE